MTDRQDIRKVIIILILLGVIGTFLRMHLIDSIMAAIFDKNIVYVNEEFDFSVTLPQAPSFAKQQIEREGFNFDFFIIESRGYDNSTYHISCYYDSVIVDSATTILSLHNGLNRVINNNGLVLYNSIDTVINNFPAIYAIAQGKGERIYFFAINKTYQIILMAADLKRDPLQRKHFEKYFYSLKMR
jgi:hypothetical protein